MGKNNFVMRAGIAAGIICRYRIYTEVRWPPLSGMKVTRHYSSAYEIYTIILLVSSYSIPSAISKVITPETGTEGIPERPENIRCAIIM